MSTSTSTSTSIAATTKKMFVYGKDDALFGCIERQQGTKPFGNLLDAGTGTHSLRWIATLFDEPKGMTHYTAVTADATMKRNVQEEADRLGILDRGNVIIGNWFNMDNDNEDNEEFPSSLSYQLSDTLYDTIIADYLIGAMDGFSPYKQDLMIPKLVKLLKPGGRLYIAGLQPLPDKADGDANIICKVRQVRDSCILLAGHRCYREYPVNWIKRQLLQEESMKLMDTSKFPILYRHGTIVKQINVGRSKFPYFATKGMATEMGKVLDDLERQSLEATQRSPTGQITLGFDYVVAAEKL